MKILDMPPGFMFSYVDSSKDNKTGRLCFTVTDSMYNKMQAKSDVKYLPLTLETKDNYCTFPYVTRRTINLWIQAHDTLSNVKVFTYDDVNSNGLIDASDTLIQTKISIQSKHNLEITLPILRVSFRLTV
ncbi:MAG: hypothetical protein R2852_07895 [Bacteroidia bacterium]